MSLALSGIAALCAALPGGASAQNNGNGDQGVQTNNVPYLAWAGEQQRLVDCFDSNTITSANAASVDWALSSAAFTVSDWSGGSQLPQVEQSSVKLFYSATEQAVCAQGDLVSLYPGMARVVLDVFDPTGSLGLGPSAGAAQPVATDQFLAGWMTLNQPTLTEMSASSFTGGSAAVIEAGKELGDPSGNGQFSRPGGVPGSGGDPGTIGSNTGYLQAFVTGSMPMDGAWSSLVGSSSITLPQDWSQLARALAVDDNASDQSPANTWDIASDRMTQVAGSTGADCQYLNTLLSVLGTLCNTVGPYDPMRLSDTLLNEGKLDSADAPMPAARIDFTILPNSGAAGDLTGVGSLAPADKMKSYSTDFLGTGTGDLFAPFYDAWLPATQAADSDAASGVDGADANFSGFLNTPGVPYHFWDNADTLASQTGTATSCLDYSSDDAPQTDTNPDDYYQLPSGITSMATYSDQHGESEAQYVPGTGFFMDNNSGVIPNADGGCDLQSLYNVPGSLGTSTITATAIYPYGPTDFPAETSAPVSTSVASMWSKTLSFVPKGPGAANNNSRIVIAHSQGIDGSPLQGEVVCFSATAESMAPFDGTVTDANGPLTLGGTSASDPTGGLGRVCQATDANGNAAAELLDSNGGSVDTIADFTNEGILRDVSVDFSTPGSTGGTPPPAPGTSPTPAIAPAGGSNSGAAAPSVATVEAVDPSLGAAVRTVHESDRARIVLIRLVTHHYVQIRVDSATRNATVRLVLVSQVASISRAGKHRTRDVKTTRSVTIATNRLVRIAVNRSVIRIAKVTLG